MAKAYQCSRCAKCYFTGEHCICLADVEPRPGHREKGGAELCRNSFVELPESEIWHEKFAWER